jgi:hypothetical protein
LIAQGRSASEVEAMPVAQAMLLYTVQTYDDLCENAIKWAFLPYAQARKGAAQAEHQCSESVRTGREIVPLAHTFLPAVKAGMTAEVRADRDIAVLQVLEAIRIYGAAHNGQLPEELNDISEVPIPPDPFRGKPFVYHRQGDTAILESPVPGWSSQGLRYQIRFAHKEK